ncbi:MAG: RHS repeat-associated core domain-containing protein, partial [Verrucomicrobiales bacterium]
AGGVGGLLAATEIKPAPAQSASKESTSLTALARSHYFLYDANGNVTQIVDAAGRLAAHYEYDPFGNVTKTGGGELALSNPWRFSTKAQDEVTGWNYYGFRHYRPEMGRWLSRDPIGERGGMHVYGFVKNDPLNRWDKLGLLDERTEGHIAKLHPKLQPLARSHITTVNGNMKREARKRGQAVVYLAKIIQSHRTYAEQDALYNQGRNGNPGPRVTNARGGFSNHNFKLAYDIAFFCGTEVKWDGWEYDVAGRIGKAFGLVWGGDWKSIVDKPHFEYPHGLTMEELREQSNGGRDDVDVPENPANPICCSPR